MFERESEDTAGGTSEAGSRGRKQASQRPKGKAGGRAATKVVPLRHSRRASRSLSVRGRGSRSRGGASERRTAPASPVFLLSDDVRPASGAPLLAQSLRMRHYLRIQPRGCGGRAISTGGWRSPLAITPLPGCGGAEDQAARRTASPRGAGPASFSLPDDTRSTPDALLPRFDVFPCDRLVAQAFVLPLLVRCHLRIQRRCGHGPRTRRSWNPT